MRRAHALLAFALVGAIACPATIPGDLCDQPDVTCGESGGPDAPTDGDGSITDAIVDGGQDAVFDAASCDDAHVDGACTTDQDCLCLPNTPTCTENKVCADTPCVGGPSAFPCACEVADAFVCPIQFYCGNSDAGLFTSCTRCRSSGMSCSPSSADTHECCLGDCIPNDGSQGGSCP